MSPAQANRDLQVTKPPQPSNLPTQKQVVNPFYRSNTSQQLVKSQRVQQSTQSLIKSPQTDIAGAKPDYSKPYQSGQKIINQKDQTPKAAQELSMLDQQDLREILLEIGRLLLMMQIYKDSHPIVHEKLSKLSLLMIKIANKFGRLVLSSREDIVLLNGYQEKVTGGPLQKLIDTLKLLKIGSFEFEKGITEQEITSFFALLAAQRRAKVTGDIKELLNKSGLTHIRPVFLQYIEVDNLPKEVLKPKNVIEGMKRGFVRGKSYAKDEQLITDFLKGETSELPKKLNSFLLDHPKLAAMVVIKLIDEYEAQNLDSFSAFQAYTQSLSHYMARISRIIKDPDKVAKTLEKLEKHLVVRLKSLKKDRKFITEAKKQIREALNWVEIEQMVSHYEEAKNNLSAQEVKIIGSIEERRLPSVKELKERLRQLGVFQSKLGPHLS